MGMSARESRRTLEAILERHWSDWSFADRGPHYSITLRHGRRSRRLAAPKTPSDYRAFRNWEADLKRAIRELKSEKGTA